MLSHSTTNERTSFFFLSAQRRKACDYLQRAALLTSFFCGWRVMAGSQVWWVDLEPKADYTVQMREQLVQDSEQNKAPEGTPPMQIAPAPMVERAFRLLDLLSVTEEGLTLSDLARSLNMSKGSIHGLLKTLENSGAIEQVEDRRFVLGPRIYDLAQTYIQRAGLRH